MFTTRGIINVDILTMPQSSYRSIQHARTRTARHGPLEFHRSLKKEKIFGKTSSLSSTNCVKTLKILFFVVLWNSSFTPIMAYPTAEKLSSHDLYFWKKNLLKYYCNISAHYIFNMHKEET